MTDRVKEPEPSPESRAELLHACTAHAYAFIFLCFCSWGPGTDGWCCLRAFFSHCACQPSPMVPCSCFCPHHMLCLPRHGFWLPGSSPFQSASATSSCNCNNSISYLFPLPVVLISSSNLLLLLHPRRSNSASKTLKKHHS